MGDVKASLGHGCAGWYVEWFDKEKDARAHWYGNREACSKRMKEAPPPLRKMGLRKGSIKIIS